MLAVGGTMIYFSSCKKDHTYSCDEKLNEYAIVNMATTQTISRNELAKLGIDTQFAIFNSLSSNNKARIFKEKFQQLMADSTVNTTDKNHIESLHNYISGILYEREEGTEDSFAVAWQAYAYNTLAWDSVKMFTYAETWLMQGEAPHTLDRVDGEGAIDNACSCSKNIACGLFSGTCKSDGCNKTRSGCGLIGYDPCTGRCWP